jgi:BlaI family penicillinase repressor
VIRMGKVQMKIMQCLWERQSASARDITDALNRDGEIAHSTVQTLLRKLEAKGAVRHTVEDRTFLFHPVAPQNEVKTSALQDLLSRAFEGSAYSLVAHLIEHERISPEELAQIRALIEKEAEK